MSWISSPPSTLGSSIDSAEITDGSIVNADVNASAAITGGKLDLTSGTTGITASGSIAANKTGGSTDQITLSSTTAGAGMTIGADTNLYRIAADGLATDDIFYASAPAKGTVNTTPASVGDKIALYANSSNFYGFGVQSNQLTAFTASGSTFAVVKSGGVSGNQQSAGSVQHAFGTLAGKTAYAITDSGAQNSGITIGTDTNLYRSAADTLKTDDALVAAVGATVPATSNAAFAGQQIAANTVLQNSLLAADANPSFSTLGDGTLRWGAGGGTAQDVRLYRSGVNVLTASPVSGGGSVALQPGSIDRVLMGGQIVVQRDSGTGLTTYNTNQANQGNAYGSNSGGKIGFYTATPVVQQTGVAVTAAGIHAALVNLGLITA